MSYYPSNIPDSSDYPDRTDEVDYVYDDRYNEIKGEVLAICLELGTLPKGDQSDVKTRLNTLGGASGCAVKRSAAQTIAGGTLTKVQLNIENFDIDNEFDPITNYRFTAKRTGKYLVIVKGRWTTPPANIYMRMYIYKNNVIFTLNEIIIATAGAHPAQCVAAVMTLAINDYLEMWVYHSHLGAIDIRGGDETSMEIMRIAG